MSLTSDERPPRPGPSLWPRIGLGAFCVVALAIIWITNQVLTQRFTETVSNRAEVRYAPVSYTHLTLPTKRIV